MNRQTGTKTLSKLGPSLENWGYVDQQRSSEDNLSKNFHIKKNPSTLEFADEKSKESK